MFPERLKQLRKSKGLSQASLAKALSVTRASLSAWESAVSKPSIDKFVEISDYFNVSLDYLFGNDSDDSINLFGLNFDERQSVVCLVSSILGKKK